ncbi:unnamed protein product [Colias eurytheme]|nr:unnamed protein product [Colias eurytheme]
MQPVRCEAAQEPLDAAPPADAARAVRRAHAAIAQAPLTLTYDTLALVNVALDVILALDVNIALDFTVVPDVAMGLDVTLALDVELALNFKLAQNDALSFVVNLALGTIMRVSMFDVEPALNVTVSTRGYSARCTYKRGTEITRPNCEECSRYCVIRLAAGQPVKVVLLIATLARSGSSKLLKILNPAKIGG